MPSTTVIRTKPLTTALVVDSPTALAPLLVCNPRRQPMAATTMPNANDLPSPPTMSPTVTADLTWMMYVTSGNPNESITTAPPMRPSNPAKMASSGVIATAAITRGTTKNPTGSSPIVVRASSSSLTFIVPSSAANAEPDLPARMMAVNNGPSSRNIERPIKLAT